MSGHAEKPKDAPGAERKPKKNWVLRLEDKLDFIWAELQVLILGIFSADQTERRASWIFLLSISGGVVLAVFALGYGMNRRAADLNHGEVGGVAGKNLGDFLQKQAEEAKEGIPSVSLGLFTVELQVDAKTKPGKRSGIVNMAEIELIVECDTPETCAYIGQSLPQARNEALSALTGLDREELLSRDGKRRVRKLLLDRLNQWLHEGKAENIYFGRLVVG